MLKRWWLFVVPSLVLVFALTLRWVNPPFLEDLQLRVFDTFQRLQPRVYRESPVRIVDLDDESLARIGQWPWPRTQVAELIRRTTDLGAAVIVFDIVFAERDRTSPAQILPLWSHIPELEPVHDVLLTYPAHDTIFAQAIAETNVVTGFPLLMDVNDVEPASPATFAYSGDDPKPYLVEFQGAVANLKELEAAAAGNGSFSILTDRDGIIRRVPLVFRLRDTLYPSLATEALRVAQGAATYIIKSSGASGETALGEHTGLTHLKIGTITVPTDAQGRLWLYDTDSVPERFIPAWKILEGGLEPHALDGMIVIIGTSAAGLKDLRATPLNPVTSGVEIHTQIVEQILHQTFLTRPDWAMGAELLYMLLLGVCLIALLPLLGPIWCALFATLVGGAVVAASWYAFTALHMLFDAVFSSLMILLVYLSASLISFLRTELERRQVQQAFSQYMSPDLVRQLLKHPERLVLGGELKNMTILFADIRGFTTISEQFDAKDLTSFINRYLTPMTELILKQRGTIDKYMGDCIMAFWNAPLDDPEHVRHACRAALDMRDHLVGWNRELRAEALQANRPFIPIHTGMGINTGDCCVGNMGSAQRFDYSVLGDEVNLASRLEGQSKTYGVDILIGEPTHAKVGDFATLELDLIMVKGKTKPTRVFGVLQGPEYREATPLFQILRARHEEFLEAYRTQRWQDARRLIDDCRALDMPRTRLRNFYALYTSRIENYLVHPPGPEWDGVFRATTK